MANTTSLQCPLPGPPVYPDVPEGADILFIGMNPGKLEEQLRRPFVGPAGKLLRRWLGEAGLLDRAGFANIELHRTFDLDQDGRQINLNREPTLIEVRGCRPVLVRTIQYMRPAVIVCVGMNAAWEFGFKGSMWHIVGKYKTWKAPRTSFYQLTYPVTVIYHPGGFLGKGLKKEEYDNRQQMVMQTLEDLKGRLDTWWE